MVTSFAYNWLATYTSTNGHQAAQAEVPFSVVVPGETVEVEIRGADGEALRLQLTNERGHQVSEQSVGRAGVVERQTLRLGQVPAERLPLWVNTSSQSRTVKVIKAQ